MKLIFVISLLLIENLFASLPAPKPIKPPRTPELVHQQNILMQQEQQREYDRLLETLGLITMISPQASPQPCKSPLLSPHLGRILSQR